MKFPVQVHQLVNLFILVGVAYALGGLQLTWWTLVGSAIAVAAVDYCLFRRRGIERFVPYTAVTTLLGTVLILFASQTYVYAVAAVAGVIQKHLFRIEGRALFNPSNFAVVFALLFFGGMCGVKEGHLGEYPLLAAAVFLMGIWILLRVDRLLIPIVYIVVYAFFAQWKLFADDPTLYVEAFAWRYVSVATVVFLMFMLTDPKTTPSRWYAQIAFAASTALAHGLLDMIFTPRLIHPFEALFIVSPLSNIVTARLPFKRKSVALAIAFAATLGVAVFLEHHHLFRLGYES
jgi:Na+-translocating ferredoxin:NAD+ oxidoreductase RnfD subunit